VVTSGRGGHFARATTHYSVRSPLHWRGWLFELREAH
jgi:hypothetical protein